MSHFAVVTPPLYSHVRAMEAVASELITRGHRVTFFQQCEARALLSDNRVQFTAVGTHIQVAGRLARTNRLLGRPGGWGITQIIGDLARTTDMLCQALPDAFSHAGIDGVIVDQMEPAGALVAQALGLGFVSVACALPVNRDDSLPLPVMPFGYGTSPGRRKLYAASTQIYDWLMRRQGDVINRHAVAFGLPGRRGLHECLSPAAQLSQTISGFDFPRQLPSCFHAVGPLRRAAGASSAVAAIYDAQPLIFASLGTLQGHRYRLFKTIADACRQLGACVVIAHCGRLNARQIKRLEAAGARTVAFTDQPAILRQAQVVITHGGLNTVMDAISCATPILVIPLAFDQFGVAARVVYHGIGRQASRFASRQTLMNHLVTLLSDDRYTRGQRALQQQLALAGGAPRAADIIEQVLTTPCPVRITADG